MGGLGVPPARALAIIPHPMNPSFASAAIPLGAVFAFFARGGILRKCVESRTSRNKMTEEGRTGPMTHHIQNFRSGVGLGLGKRSHGITGGRAGGGHGLEARCSNEIHGLWTCGRPVCGQCHCEQASDGGSGGGGGAHALGGVCGWHAVPGRGDPYHRAAAERPQPDQIGEREPMFAVPLHAPIPIRLTTLEPSSPPTPSPNGSVLCSERATLLASRS